MSALSSNCPADPSWSESQSRAYAGWVNSYLSELGEEVSNLCVDMADGLRLVHLVELLEERQRAMQTSGEADANTATASPFANYHRTPKLKFHKIEKSVDSTDARQRVDEE